MTSDQIKQALLEIVQTVTTGANDTNRANVQAAIKKASNDLEDLADNLFVGDADPDSPALEVPDAPPTEEETLTLDDVILPLGVDRNHYLGKSRGDNDPAHNEPLPAGTIIKGKAADVDPVTLPESEGSPAAPPITTNPVTTAIDLRPENDTDWLSQSWLGNVEDFVRQDAQSEEGTSVFVAYDVPNRDNGNFSAGGAPAFEQYAAFTDAVSKGIGDEPALVIEEPDALGLLPGLSDDAQKLRIKCLQYAVNRYNKYNPNTTVALDASMWVNVPEMAGRLSMVMGDFMFSLNVSAYEKLEDAIAYGTELYKLTGRRFVIDTSRNGKGNPHKPAWCNVTDTMVGHEPTTNTGIEGCAAFIWAKKIGESDGQKINGYDNDGQQVRSDVPTAGTHWQLLEDAQRSGDWTEFKKEMHV